MAINHTSYNTHVSQGCQGHEKLVYILLRFTFPSVIYVCDHFFRLFGVVYRYLRNPNVIRLKEISQQVMDLIQKSIGDDRFGLAHNKVVT